MTVRRLLLVALAIEAVVALVLWLRADEPVNRRPLGPGEWQSGSSYLVSDIFGHPPPTYFQEPAAPWIEALLDYRRIHGNFPAQFSEVVSPVPRGWTYRVDHRGEASLQVGEYSTDGFTYLWSSDSGWYLDQ